MSKGPSSPVLLDLVEDSSAARVFASKETKVARRGRTEHTKLERRGKLDLEHMTTAVMPPPPKHAPIEVASVADAPARIASDYDIAPFDDAPDTVSERPHESVWAAAVTRSMAAVWREVSRAHEEERADTDTITATASLVPLATAAHKASPSTPTPSAAENPRVPTPWRRKKRRRGMAAPLLCALMLWLVDAPLVDDGVALGMKVAARSEQAAVSAWQLVREVDVSVRWFARVVARSAKLRG